MYRFHLLHIPQENASVKRLLIQLFYIAHCLNPDDVPDVLRRGKYDGLHHALGLLYRLLPDSLDRTRHIAVCGKGRGTAKVQSGAAVPAEAPYFFVFQTIPALFRRAEGCLRASLRFLFFRGYFYRSCTRRARMALSTARTITPTSAKIPIHILATPTATSSRHNSLTPREKTMFSCPMHFGELFRFK